MGSIVTAAACVISSFAVESKLSLSNFSHAHILSRVELLELQLDASKLEALGHVYHSAPELTHAPHPAISLDTCRKGMDWAFQAGLMWMLEKIFLPNDVTATIVCRWLVFRTANCLCGKVCM